MNAEELIAAAKNKNVGSYKEAFDAQVKSRIAQKIEEVRKNIVSNK